MNPKTIKPNSTPNINSVESLHIQYKNLTESIRLLDLQIFYLNQDMIKNRIDTNAGLIKKIDLEKVKANILSMISILEKSIIFKKGLIIDEVV